jgi:hypothetical protein
VWQLFAAKTGHTDRGKDTARPLTEETKEEEEQEEEEEDVCGYTMSKQSDSQIPDLTSDASLAGSPENPYRSTAPHKRGSHSSTVWLNVSTLWGIRCEVSVFQ